MLKDWCNYCEEEHNEDCCSVAMLRRCREDKFEDDGD